MRALSVAARAYILCVLLAAACCTLPALWPGAGVPWRTAALLAALCAGCELLGRRPFLVSAVRVGAGSFFPVLFAAVLLLPPPAAALVAVPGALVGHVEQRPRAVRRVWRAAQLALAAWCAAHICAHLDGGAALGGGAGGLGPSQAVPDFPYVLLPAGAAVLGFCLVLTALDGGILATAERLPARTAWRGLLLRSVPPHCVQGLAGLMTAVLWRSPYGPLAALFVLLPMYISCWVFAQYHRERAAHQATIRALVQAVDLKDQYTRGHSERVGRASVMIARELGMEEDRVEGLRFAGILHDVGKLGVPTRLLRKDGPLTPEERRVIELHPEYGHEMVRGIGFLGEARAAILHHHERLDGSGYPYGLAGGQIPEFARVVAVADAFDAMTSTRSYRRARPVATAVRELERCAGTQFDPRMVQALTRALARHGWHVRVTSDEQTDPRGNVPPPRGGDTSGAGEGSAAPAGAVGRPQAPGRSE
ncbi:metal-dependent phosphohydrolase [Streptomyces agglomeratus]|uniref:Metal-dependent phosphohydrolase n=1 Tax=Streptomyces agglomeratus TaxID=285458 RepID=A0A1E5P6F2_9ACTN|nr:HD-GYP domain-containing protein [Streptomyces agglomeratus]OEJ25099.1 metal-dependent phosphohydrolase [Streptomyces agglomeratus]OEJ40872.1 metal-dependent phosphohydrolase [Streptomyces agglomeratus]OEJ44747.1 metal-dependent phosphohydrolase [Streptomyces agglomeratus]OEJ53412.1 metal-dependent phosphohydrolase [Streptomyces agglomeratus]OEJ60749.1 metal-dependent phosphohydrolase [Streptomyces agglomeratus]